MGTELYSAAIKILKARKFPAGVCRVYDDMIKF
jgi:hypothetical protein